MNRLSFVYKLLAAALASFAFTATADEGATADSAPVVLRVYGPGGPAPAMKEAATAFSAKHKNVKVEVTAGPTPQWKDHATKDADLIYSGAEFMMTDFMQKDLPGVIDAATVRTLYLRPSAILVRPGNPKGIQGVKDLGKPGIKLMVVQGAGQLGMWEDVAGRTGEVEQVEAVRRNIGFHATNSGEAKKRWAEDTSFDAWLIWTIWQKESPAAADLVPTEPEYTIYRSCGIALANRSRQKRLAKQFADFVQSPAGQAIFVRLGWRER